MSDVLLQPEVEVQSKHKSYIHELFNKTKGILQQHRHDNPDLYHKIEEKKIIKEANKNKVIMPIKGTSHNRP